MGRAREVWKAREARQKEETEDAVNVMEEGAIRQLLTPDPASTPCRTRKLRQIDGNGEGEGGGG